MKLNMRLAARISLAVSASWLCASSARAQYLGDVQEAKDHVGSALARGDFDGDGVQDLAIGVPDESVLAWSFPGGGTTYPGAGAVHVLYGVAGNGLTTAGTHFLRQGVTSAPNLGIGSYHAFGKALVAGDLNADAFDDLAIGIPGQTVNGFAKAGGVQVLLGSAQGLRVHEPIWWTQDSTGIADQAEAGDGFGSSLAVGDADGDGFLDLAIGVPLEAVGSAAQAGGVHVLRGSPTGFAKSGHTWWTAQQLFLGPEVKAHFGFALAFGDFDADGFDDLAIGAPESFRAQTYAGAVHVLRGSASGPSGGGAQLWHQSVAGVAGIAEAYEQFGFALAAADLDGDGFEDLAIGVPGDVVLGMSAGGVNALFGSAAGLAVTDNLLISQADPFVIEDPEEGDRFGAALAILEFDGFAYLSIGVPGESVGKIQGAGALETVGIGARFVGYCHFFTGYPSEDRGFGSAAAMGDYNGDGYEDFAVGMPLLDSFVPDAGGVHVAYAYEPFPQQWVQAP